MRTEVRLEGVDMQTVVGNIFDNPELLEVEHEVLFALGATGIATEIEEIIRSHMNDEDNNGWIPVEDGLPEEGEEVEVTIEEMADSAGGMRYYTKTAWVQEERWVIKRNPCNPRVIAWRSLPEPYKPKKDIQTGTEHIMSRFMKVE